MIKAHFFHADVPPLPDGAPVDDIAQWLAQVIERTGKVSHWWAETQIHIKFGPGFSYRAPKFNWRGELARDHRGRVQHRDLIHPEILRALKKYKNVLWGKDCREWYARKVNHER
jgi:hypothetical protein